VTRVLVVDDEPTIREIVVSYLEREGFKTLEAADGNRARELLERDAPDLVVLDVMLPGTDGLELCRWIRSRSRLPVIMLTARGEESDRMSATDRHCRLHPSVQRRATMSGPSSGTPASGRTVALGDR
jgi:DNA-binding response OmpR family regulator